MESVILAIILACVLGNIGLALFWVLTEVQKPTCPMCGRPLIFEDEVLCDLCFVQQITGQDYEDGSGSSIRARNSDTETPLDPTKEWS